MEKVYVKKISSKDGKKLFNGSKAVKVQYGDKIVNMVGEICSPKCVEVIFCSYLTQRAINYGAIVSEEFIVDKNTKDSFIVVK